MSNRMPIIEALKSADMAAHGIGLGHREAEEACIVLARAYRAVTLGVDYDPVTTVATPIKAHEDFRVIARESLENAVGEAEAVRQVG